MYLRIRILSGCALLLFVCGCNQMLAEKAVTAPNLLWEQRGMDNAPQELAELYVSHQLRVPVGPPDASISVHVIEPFNGDTDVELVGRRRDTRAKIVRKASTQPTTVPSAPRGTVVLLHGIQDFKELGPYVMYREYMAHAGYRVVQVDLRGHGRSTGDKITFGVVEARDLVQVMDELERRNLIAGKVGALGVSYGAAVAIQWAAIDRRVKAIVVMEPYCDFRDIAHDASHFVLGKWRKFFSDRDIDAAVNRAGRLGGFDPRDASPVRAITRTSAPVLIIHSRSDQLIPWQHSQRLHNAAPMHSKLMLMTGPNHFNLWLKSKQVIREASLEWFEKYLTTGPEMALRE